jgi:hypothetical protein
MWNARASRGGRCRNQALTDEQITNIFMQQRPKDQNPQQARWEAVDNQGDKW